MFSCYMAWFRHIHWIIALALFLTVKAQDLTLVSRPPDVTYVELGKTLTLNVTYQTTGNLVVTWRKDGKNLYTTGLGSPDPRVSIKGQATLVLINTTLSDNGIYENTVTTFTSSKDINLIVIIQVQPIAIINCPTKNTVKEGDNFNCLCNHTGGNTPPTASWYKDGKVVSGPGYLKTTLSLKNIKGSDSGNYSCIVESHDLNDTKSVEIQVQFPPEETSDLSVGVIAAIAVGCGFFFILVVVLICCCCCKHDKCVVCCCCCIHMIYGVCCRSNSKKVRDENENENEIDLADRGIANVSVVKENFNAYESVDKEKIKPNEEAGTSGNGEPARVDSPPSMPPVYVVVDKKSIKKKTPADDERPASLTYASLDPVLLQPDSSKMRDRSREESNYADIDMAKLQNDKT